MSNILVVDDMAVFREPIAAALRSHGFKTICAANGVEALAACRNNRPDLILLDLGMPEMDGLQFLRVFPTAIMPPRPPVIVLTAVSDRDYVVQAVKLGAKDFLLKSQFSLVELVSRVKRCLDATAASGRHSGSRAETPAVAAPATSPDNTPAAPASPASLAAPPAPSQPATPAAEQEPIDSSMPAALRAIRPLLTRSQIRDMLDHVGDIKAMSPSVGQVLALCRSSNCSIEAISRALKQDHALALTILKLANSSAYCRGEPIESVQKAVARIGLQQTRQMVANISVIDAFSQSACTDAITPESFWEHSIACGLICGHIARALGGSADEADTAFTLGLLHDVGRMVYFDMLGPTYRQVIDTAASLQLPLEQVESRMLMVNHADAMDRVLHAWHFPKHLIDPIVFHHLSAGNMRRMSPRMLRECSMLALADRLAHAMLLGDSGNPSIYPTHEYVQALALAPSVIDEIENSVAEQAADLKLTMLSRSHHTAWRPAVDQLRDQLASPLRPIVISAEPAFDPFRLLFSRLASASEGPPNLAVVHITHPRQRDSLAETLRQRESELNVSGLAAIYFSATGQLTLDPRTAGPRPTLLMPSAITLSRIVVSLNAMLQRSVMVAA